MKYPAGTRIREKNISHKENVVYANGGMDLENDINQSNEYYREIDKALIYKKPTPIKIQDVSYTGKGKVIQKAYFESPSTTDYNGIYKGKYIDFEAKETISSSSFPIKNIHQHQIDHMMRVLKHGGICFLIVRFVKQKKNYLLLAEDLKKFLETETRSSIPLSYFEKYGKVIDDGYMPRLDYLKIIDQIYGGVFDGKKSASL